MSTPRRKRCKRYNIPCDAHELTFSCYKRRPFLSKKRTCLWLADAIRNANEKYSFHLWAYVFMPEHVHLLLWPTQQDYDISRWLKSVKQSVGRRALIYLRNHGPEDLKWLATGQEHDPYRFWQDGGGYDRNVQRHKTTLHMAEYIHNNPVRRRLVESAQDWYWSSARAWEMGSAEPIPIDRATFPAL